MAVLASMASMALVTFAGSPNRRCHVGHRFAVRRSVPAFREGERLGLRLWFVADHDLCAGGFSLIEVKDLAQQHFLRGHGGSVAPRFKASTVSARTSALRSATNSSAKLTPGVTSASLPRRCSAASRRRLSARRSDSRSSASRHRVEFHLGQPVVRGPSRRHRDYIERAGGHVIAGEDETGVGFSSGGSCHQTSPRLTAAGAPPRRGRPYLRPRSCGGERRAMLVR